MKIRTGIQGSWLAASLVLMVFASLAVAQLPVQLPSEGPAPAKDENQSIKGATLKGKAPINKEVLKVTLPKAQEAALPNGLRLVLLESHKVPTFSMEMQIHSGGLSDPADHRGLASFTAALLREGT